jgi:hypothetical protein
MFEWQSLENQLLLTCLDAKSERTAWHVLMAESGRTAAFDNLDGGGWKSSF